MNNKYREWIRDFDATEDLEDDELAAYQGPESWNSNVFYAAQVLFTVTAVMDYAEYLQGWTVYELRVKKKAEGQVLLMVKARKGSKGKITFVRGDTFRDALNLLETGIRVGALAWKEDAYAKF